MPRMELDPGTCYRAIRSRDPRFDGRFFTAVRSTGVYCRPICPARTPLLRNVRFFACAAAAEAAGFRPCRRCRPETSPGTPGWMGASATVARALRLIEQGGLDHQDLERFARRLGIGSRHLRRLFLEHLGAPPVAVARTRRAHFARRLLDETRLPMGEVAFAAGYESVRQFNHDVREIFRLTPSALRRAAPAPAAGDGALALRLPFRPPYDWQAISGFLAARAVPGLERVEDGVYRRTFRGRGGSGVLEVAPDVGGHALRLRVAHAGTADLLEIVRDARRLFDLDADPATIAARLAGSPRLRRAVAARPGLRVPGAWDPFETAVRVILGQQVSVQAATTLCARLVAAYGEPLRAARGPELSLLFPSARRLAESDLAAVRMPGARKRAIRALATEVAAGRLSFDGAGSLDQLLARLREIPGVGEWTAQVIAMRCCGEPDAFPAGDLGVRQALSRAGRAPSIPEALRIAEDWRPWRAYACMHLWIHSASTKRPRRKEPRHAS